ncbi:MAG: hypothetical protein EYC62_03170 [Alphaproteobacteria bacterium]|nr:MAG: hypothetical protein EYC62_03170 [Alphaproteobacteria bacterium]
MTSKRDAVIAALAEQGLKLETITDPPSSKIVSFMPLCIGVQETTFHTSGVAPRRDGKVPSEFIGKLGKENWHVPMERAQLAAAHCAATLLGIVDKICEGDWDRVAGLVHLTGLVNHADPEFADFPKVTDAASGVFLNTLGPEIGQHCRTSSGVSGLPGRYVVEMNLSLRVRNK